MNLSEIEAYVELFGRLRLGNESQINLIIQEINRLHSEIDRRRGRDIAKEIYEQHDISNKDISLMDFKSKLYSYIYKVD